MKNRTRRIGLEIRRDPVFLEYVEGERGHGPSFIHETFTSTLLTFLLIHFLNIVLNFTRLRLHVLLC